MSIAFAVALTATIWAEPLGDEHEGHMRRETRIPAAVAGAVQLDRVGRWALWEQLGLCRGIWCEHQNGGIECHWRIETGKPCIDFADPRINRWRPTLEMLIDMPP